MFLAYSIEDKIKNEDMLWEQVERKEAFLKALPPRITFQTSQRCNLSCRFCGHFRTKYIEGKSPMEQPVMDVRLIEKVASQVFPTLQYYESTLLGDPFLSPHLDRELELAAKYNVFFRPTTNGTTITASTMDKIDGRVDWLKCSMDSHVRSIYNFIRIGARFENTVKKLKQFNKIRETMKPVPYFRLGFVLTDLNMETLPEYLVYAHEELGVDDVEVMGFNIDEDHMEALQVFDKVDLVNKVLEKTIEVALAKKYKIRLAFTRMPKPGGDRNVCQKLSAQLRKDQESIGFVKPRDFEKMSYVIQNPRHRGEIGDVGYVWSNNMRRQDICEEFFNRPFIRPNGNVESCGNCNAFLLGNLKRQSFPRIWNSPYYQGLRQMMYEKDGNEQWHEVCQSCICMNVTYDRSTSDRRNRFFYRVVPSRRGGEKRISIGRADRPVAWLGEDRLLHLARLTRDLITDNIPEKARPFSQKVYQKLKRSFRKGL